MTELKDVIHLYLGCKVALSGTVIHFTLEAVYKDKVAIREYNRRFKTYVDFKNIKPILRKLDSMTKTENKELANIIGCELDTEVHIWTPDQFLWLLSKHFDLFGLIKNGLAIYKNKTHG